MWRDGHCHETFWHLAKGVTYRAPVQAAWFGAQESPMKKIAIKVLSALSLVAVLATVAMTTACPPAAEGEGEGE